MLAHVRQLRPRTRRASRPRARAGFTLLETALATIIVGVGIVASMQLFATCSVQNRASNQMTAAMLLCDNVREAMAGLNFNDPTTGKTTWGAEESGVAAFDDVDDFDGQTFDPPIDSLRATIPTMSQYSQVVAVVPIFVNKLNSNTNDSALEVSKGTYTGAARVRVRVLYRLRPTDVPTEVYRCSWVRMDN
jgi:type II secretory pathway pseudopilin PulG